MEARRTVQLVLLIEAYLHKKMKMKVDKKVEKM